MNTNAHTDRTEAGTAIWTPPELRRLGLNALFGILFAGRRHLFGEPGIGSPHRAWYNQ